MGESFKSKMSLVEAQMLADNLKRELEKHGHQKVVICGSVRREKPEVGDLDVIVVGDLAWLAEPGRPWRYVDGGAKKCTVDYEGRQVNILKTEWQSLGAAMLYFTGNSTFNLIMRRNAKKAGYKLNEYGLWREDVFVAGLTEQSIFQELGMKYREPKDRSK